MSENPELTPEERAELEAEFDRESDIAEAAFEAMLEELPRDVDPIGVFYSLFTLLVHFLAEEWSEEDLIDSVKVHHRNETTAGTA